MTFPKVWLKAVPFAVFLAVWVVVRPPVSLSAWDLVGDVAAANQVLAQATVTPSVTLAATLAPSTPGTPSPVPTTTGTPGLGATPPVSPSLTVEPSPTASPSPTAVPSSTATPSPTAAPSSTPLPSPTPLLLPTPTITVVLAELPETPTPVHSTEQEQLGALTVLSFVGLAAFVIVLAIVWVLRKPMQK